MSHIALVTNPFDSVTAFYGGTLGFPTVEGCNKPSGRGQRFGLGHGLHLEILDNIRDRRPVALDTSAWVHVVEEADMHPLGTSMKVPAPVSAEPSLGARLCQIQDPDGVPVTFLEWKRSEGSIRQQTALSLARNRA